MTLANIISNTDDLHFVYPNTSSGSSLVAAQLVCFHGCPSGLDNTCMQIALSNGTAKHRIGQDYSLYFTLSWTSNIWQHITQCNFPLEEKERVFFMLWYYTNYLISYYKLGSIKIRVGFFLRETLVTYVHSPTAYPVQCTQSALPQDKCETTRNKGEGSHKWRWVYCACISKFCFCFYRPKTTAQLPHIPFLWLNFCSTYPCWKSSINTALQQKLCARTAEQSISKELLL